MEFEELKRKFDVLKVLMENQETRLRYHETRAHNIAMAYLIWERLFLFGLSMEAGDHSISSDGFDFSFHVQVLEYHPYRIVQRKVYIASTLCALLAVTVFELYMCQYSLCN